MAAIPGKRMTGRPLAWLKRCTIIASWQIIVKRLGQSTLHQTRKVTADTVSSSSTLILIAPHNMLFGTCLCIDVTRGLQLLYSKNGKIAHGLANASEQRPFRVGFRGEG